MVAAALAAVHLFSWRFGFLDATPRSVWLSIAGGVSVAYVFVHLLPELGEGQSALSGAAGVSLLEREIYLVALAGLAVFYGLERMARRYGAPSSSGGSEGASPGVFWVHLVSYGTYNALVGYLLLHRNETGGLWIFGVAMALHFIVNDHGLRTRHRTVYTRRGRWLLAAAVFGGWVLGSAAELPESGIAALTAFLAGGVILNVLKEELPEERESRFWAFAAGATIYALLLLAI